MAYICTVMPTFPAQYSTLSSIALNRKLQGSYNLIDTECKLLIRNVSDAYVLTSPTKKYLFKIYRDAHRKLDEIQGEVELLTILYQNGAKVSYPIPDKNGDMLQVFQAAEGTRYGVLFSWAEGSVVHTMSGEQLDTVGREMAIVHQITSSIELKRSRKAYTIDNTILTPIKIIEPAFTGLANEYEYLTITAKQVVPRLRQLDYHFSYGYCHFDFFPKNFHFKMDGGITFFDFDFAGKGLLAYDITSFFIHYFLEVHFGKITAEEGRSAFKTFVGSYRKVRPLTDQELRAIPDLGFAFWVFYLGFQYENFDDWSNSFFGPGFLKTRVALIKIWMETAHLLLP